MEGLAKELYLSKKSSSFNAFTMKSYRYKLSLLLVWMFFAIFDAHSQKKEMVVGFQVAPPFIVKDDGSYSGVGMDLWAKIADSLHVSYSVKEFDLTSLVEAIHSGEVDVAISPLAVTASRMKLFDFTQPYFITNLAFATKADKGKDLMSFFLDFFSFNFFKAVGSLFLIILIFGLVLWVVENKKNPGQFRPGVHGVGDGIWWSAVTMTTVGYGDKSPITAWGRIISVVWMFTGVIIISGLTAGISSSLTIHNLNTEVAGLDDLRKVKVGSITASGTADFLQRYKIKYNDFNSVEEGLMAVSDETIDAFVYDDAALNYYVHTLKYDDAIHVIPSVYSREYFSFASADRELIKKINEVLIGIIESNEWESDLKKYHIEYRN